MQNLNQQEDLSILQEFKIQGLKTNPALDYSLQLLLLGKRLSKISQIDDKKIDQIREKIINEISSFSASLTKLKIYDETDITRLKFCLCVFLDGILMQNEIFLQSSYTHNTITLRYFKEQGRGDKFFAIINKWLENPTKNKDMLEFIYVCLLLGYRGHYAVNSETEEKITYLCEVIASNLIPSKTDDMAVFESAYKNYNQETFWQKYFSLIIKLVVIIIPLATIIVVYLIQFAVIQKDIFKMTSTISSQISSYKKLDETKIIKN